MFVHPVIVRQVTLIQSQITIKFPAFAEGWWLRERSTGVYPNFESIRWGSRDILQPLPTYPGFVYLNEII
jgi:hypothetical protein